MTPTLAWMMAQATPAEASGSLPPLLRGVLAALLYSLVGLFVFGLAFSLINRLVPFSLRKEIEEDQNTALGVVLGSVFLGIAIIIAAAVRG